jgi:hypothetical protein
MTLGENFLEKIINQGKNRVSIMLSDGTLGWIDKHKSFFKCNTIQDFIVYAISKEIEHNKKLRNQITTESKKWGYEY